MKHLIGLALAALVAGTVSAAAAPFYDTSLNAPSVYFGSGNVNAHYTVERQGSVELGLQTVQRYIGPYIPTGSTYYALAGATTVPGKTGSDWGVVFSVNLNADGLGTLDLSDITATLTLTDVAKGTTGSLDLSFIPDNSLYGPGGKCSPSFICGPASGYYAFQNSEALSFVAIAAALGDPGYDMSIDDTYFWTLALTDCTDTLIASTSMTTIVGKGAEVPEPLTISLFGAGLAGMAFARKRKSA